jgi:hypothetical protein
MFNVRRPSGKAAIRPGLYQRAPAVNSLLIRATTIANEGPVVTVASVRAGTGRNL